MLSGGVELPWDVDPDLKIDTKPMDLFPPVSRFCFPLVAHPSRPQIFYVQPYGGRCGSS